MPLSDDSRSGLSRLLPSSQLPQGGVGRGRHLTYVVVLLVGMLITWFAYDLVSIAASNDLQLRFEREASQMAAGLQSQFDLSFEYLLAIPPFFQASDEVTEQDFRHFVSDALKRHPGIYTFEFLLKVTADELTAENLAAFQSNARRQSSSPEFAVHAVDDAGERISLPERDAYFPVYYGEPLIKGMIGVDIASHPVQGPYVEKARWAKSPIATHPLSLIEDPDDVLSVIALAPVRRLTSEDGNDCFGIAILILRVRPVVELALGQSGLEGFQLSLIDSDAGESRDLVYRNYPGESLTSSRARWPVASRQIHFADQAWELSVSPALGSEFAPVRPPYWILLSGFALSALAAYSLSATVAIGGLRKQVDEAVELGQYRLGKKLGEGGMGVVYEAEHRMLARPAAIKLIQMDPSDSGTHATAKKALRLSRFEKEAKATAGLESPHTISIYDFGKTPAGDFYYVMELLEGTDLSTLVKKFGPIPSARMIHLIRQVCHSLSEAHQKGLIHRDIKPANIFNCRFALQYDFAKVLDFGLVKSSRHEGPLEITQPGSFIGTPAFISPEMLVSESVDGRADLYSLGCVMYWLLAGRVPFAGASATAVMAQHLNRAPQSLCSLMGDVIPKELDEIVLHCLAKKPDDRPQTAEELEKMLASCAVELPWTQFDAEQRWQIESRGHHVIQEHDTKSEIAPALTVAENGEQAKMARGLNLRRES